MGLCGNHAAARATPAHNISLAPPLSHPSVRAKPAKVRLDRYGRQIAQMVRVGVTRETLLSSRVAPLIKMEKDVYVKIPMSGYY